MRAGAGVALLTLVEAIAGIVLMATTVPGFASVGVSAIVGLATVPLVILSTTTTHLFQLRSLSRAREESAGSRLYTSITYGVGSTPRENAAGREEGAAAPGEDTSGLAETAAAPETIEPEMGFIDPITAALQAGHFNAEAFMRDARTGEVREEGDAEASDGGPADTDVSSES